MVVLNGTTFIILGLFLLFLWAVNVFILRPLLDTMDARDDKLTKEQEQAAEDVQQATELERQHLRAVAAAQREVHEGIERDRRKAQEELLDVTRQHGPGRLSSHRLLGGNVSGALLFREFTVALAQEDSRHDADQDGADTHKDRQRAGAILQVVEPV